MLLVESRSNTGLESLTLSKSQPALDLVTSSITLSISQGCYE